MLPKEGFLFDNTKYTSGPLAISKFSIRKTFLPFIVKTVKKSLEFSGEFQKIDYNVEGSFKVYSQNGKKVLRIENLANGPDVYLVLSNKKPSFGNKNYRIVDKLKANKGSFNVELESDIDFSKYKYLLIHCKTFSHTFAGAEIAAISP